MNAAFVILAALAVAVGGYRWYAGYVDRKVVEVDPKRATPADVHGRRGLHAHRPQRPLRLPVQVHRRRRAGGGRHRRPAMGLAAGHAVALSGVVFIGWLHDYTSAMVAMRNEGMSLGGLSYRLISPRARLILLSFVYFYLLLVAGAFGAVIAGALAGVPVRSGACWSWPGGPAGGPDDLPLAGQHPGDQPGLRRPGPGGHQAGGLLPGARCCSAPWPEQTHLGPFRLRLLLPRRHALPSGASPSPSTTSPSISSSWGSWAASSASSWALPAFTLPAFTQLPSPSGPCGPCSSSPSPAAPSPAGTAWCPARAPAASWRAKPTPGRWRRGACSPR